MSSGQMKPRAPSGAGSIPWITLIRAGEYLINKAAGKTIPPEQQDAWDSLNNAEKEVVQETVQEGVEVGVVPEPKTVPTTTPLPMRRPKRDNAPPPPTQSPTTSPVNTESKKTVVKRLMELLGDPRTMTTVSNDVEATKRMEEERGMNVAGRKKGGMVKKKKTPVKKAYGGMVKKKQGGSARKVNMKAGFTRRGCSKG